jgi:hypothetical protein
LVNDYYYSSASQSLQVFLVVGLGSPQLLQCEALVKPLPYLSLSSKFFCSSKSFFEALVCSVHAPFSRKRSMRSLSGS